MFPAITTKEQAEALDDVLCTKGYRHGLRDTPDTTQTEQAYWHGYFNGQVDGGYMEMTEDMLLLAEDYTRKTN